MVMVKKRHPEKEYVVCTENSGYEASLEIRKIYEVLPDREANAHGLIRVIDESGEDCLFPGQMLCSYLAALPCGRSIKIDILIGETRLHMISN